MKVTSLGIPEREDEEEVEDQKLSEVCRRTDYNPIELGFGVVKKTLQRICHLRPYNELSIQDQLVGIRL
jgi:hypothetical protein